MDISNISAAQAGAVPPSAPRGAGRADASRPAAASRGRDRIELSTEAVELARAEQAVQESDDLRFDVVARLRGEVRDGAYRIDARAVARAMVDRGDRAE